MRCEDYAEALSAYADGEVEGAERVRLEQHIAVCELCRQQLTLYRQVSRHLRSLGDVQPAASLRMRILGSLPSEHRPGGWGRVLPQMAAALVMLGFMFVVAAAFSSWLDRDPDTQLVAQLTPTSGIETKITSTAEVPPTPLAVTDLNGPDLVTPSVESPSTMAVEVYFSNESLDVANGVYLGNEGGDSGAGQCGRVHPVKRVITNCPAVARATLEQLFSGPTLEESIQGYTSPFSTRTEAMLRSINIVGGIAYVDLVDIRQIIPNVSTACGSAQFFSQVETTLKQFSTVKKVIYAIEGQPATFYEWMQIGCDDKIGNCDEAPFRPVTIIRAEAKLNLAPRMAQPGQLVRFQGEGFTPLGKVSVLLVEGLGLIVGDVEADRAGRISGQFRVPEPGSGGELTYGPVAVFAIDEASRQRTANVFVIIERP